MKPTIWGSLALAAVLCASASCAQAQVQTRDAWVRATVPQQKATGGFLILKSAQAAKLVAAQSPLAERVEIHEMSMADGVMRMREIDALPLPAGQEVALKPGGFHLMFMGLKQQAQAGEEVPLTLVIEAADGKRESHPVRASVRPLNR
jgi:copper(I)-binding protein